MSDALKIAVCSILGIPHISNSISYKKFFFLNVDHQTQYVAILVMEV